MCLAVPGRVIDIFEEAGLKMGRIDYAGTISRACLAYIPEIEIGQYTIVHAGFALSIIDPEEAVKSFETWKELIETAARNGDNQYNDQLQTLEELITAAAGKDRDDEVS
jgi:hydrogenase expression/formation protein HypC